MFAIKGQLVGPMQFKHAMLWHTYQSWLDLQLAIINSFGGKSKEVLYNYNGFCASFLVQKGAKEKRRQKHGPAFVHSFSWFYQKRDKSNVVTPSYALDLSPQEKYTPTRLFFSPTEKQHSLQKENVC